MTELEPTVFLDLEDIMPREQSLNESTYAILKEFPIEKQHDVIDKYLMGQSIITMTELPSIVSEFVDIRLIPERDESDITVEFNYYFFGHSEKGGENKTLNAMNSVEASYYDSENSISYKAGVGILNCESIGGFFYSQEGEEGPTYDKYLQQIITHGVKLTPTLNNVYIPEKTKHEEIEQYAQLLLDDAFERYWNCFGQVNVHSPVKNRTYFH